MANHANSTRAPIVRAFSLLAELIAAAAVIGGGSVLTALATLA